MFDKLEYPELNVKEVIKEIEKRSQRKTTNINKFLSDETKRSLVDEERKYEKFSSELFKLKPCSEIGDYDKNVANKIYDGVFKKKIREEYMSQYIGTSCPICGQTLGVELDHVLPKSKFVQFTVTPINLVPICHNCNYWKGDNYGNTYANSSFHPFYEDFSSLNGLHFNFNFCNKTSPIEIIYDKKKTNPKFIHIMKEYDMEGFLTIQAVKKLRQIEHDLCSIKVSGTEKMSVDNFQKTLNAMTEYIGLSSWEKIFICDLMKVNRKFYSVLEF
ncbi:hypothetical protein GA840_00985 [Pediococcus ethanolidurans]|uniref:HNH endonuclease n=1 Tax=Pediococcus ethanolidurans TaxID=319653 RepID=UPI002953F5B8|nr:HNH endonuclease signature motif containing protein [Pediococcus ethanolidurans]MDV7718460.1 hypothetical protein [Pediococcus ethanolidurans]